MKIIFRYTQLLLFLFILSPFAFAHFGPRSPLTGTATCAINYNGIVYFGTEAGGVFESTNSQITAWRPRPVGLLTGKISALTHSGSYLFAGTADGGVYVFNGFVGSDRHWNKASNGLGNMAIQSLVAVDSITVLAGTADGLYKTTDKGASWTAVNDVNMNNAVVSSLTKGGGRYFATTHAGGVFASDDAGMTWMSFNDANTLQISGLKLSYNDTTDVLMVLNSVGLFVAGNASTTMAPTYTSAISGLSLGTDVRGLANNGTTWYLATSNGVYTSPNSSILWTAANGGLSNTDATAITALPANVVVAARKTGMYKSPTAAVAWTLTNTGFANPVTHSMITSGDSLVIAVTEQGIYVSKKLGSPATTFVRSNTGLADSSQVVDIILAKTILFAATPAGVYMSQDTGMHWMAANNGLSNFDIQKLFYGNNQVYALDAQGGLHTKDLGMGAWSSVQSGLPNGAMPTSMAFYGNRIVVGTMGDGVYMKSQHDASWSAFNTGLTTMDVTSVTAASGRFYAGTDGDGVFSTLADSADWTVTSQTSIPFTSLMGLDGDHIQAMNSYAGYVYCSYKGGVLASSDEGAIWEEAGVQFNLPSFTDVHKISFVTSRVFALTENNGPYSNGLSELPALPNFLALSDDAVHAPQPGRSDFITVTSNVPWTIASGQSWITVNPVNGFRDGTLEIVTAANPGAMRMGQVTLTSDSLTQPLVIDVMQDGLVAIGNPVSDGTTFHIVPNPNNGQFTLEIAPSIEGATQATILDLSGRKVADGEIDPSQQRIGFQLNVAPGTYIVRLETAAGAAYQKLLIH